MSVKEKGNAFLDKLPFKSMMEKIPAETRAKVPGLDKMIPFTNHIVCGFIVILLLLIISGFIGGDGGGTTAVKSNKTKNVDTSDFLSAIKQTTDEIKDTAGSNKTASKSSSKGSAFSKSPGKANSDKDFEYRLTYNGDKVEITKYIGSSGTVVIPQTIEGMPVERLTAVQDIKGNAGLLKAFVKESVMGGLTGNDGIFKNAVNVYVPDGINIERDVFKNCNRLKEVRLPNDLEYIEISLFEGCGQLETVNMPSALKGIAGYAFKKCKKLTEIDLPDNITIGGYVFEETGIKNIRLPSGIKTIVNNNTYNAIWIGMFKKSALESIIIPEGVEIIGPSAFEECTKLTSVSLPSTIKSIGILPVGLSITNGSTFRKCKNLTTLQISDSVSAIKFDGTGGNYDFTETNLPLKTQARLKQLGYTDAF